MVTRLSSGGILLFSALGFLFAQPRQVPFDRVVFMTNFGGVFQYSISSVQYYVPAIRLELRIGHSLGLRLEEIRRGCTASVEGDPTDRDGDGFPVGATYHIRCGFPAHELELEGKISVRDNNEGDPRSGGDLCTGVFTPAGCSREPLKSRGYDYYALDIDSEYAPATNRYIFKRYYWMVYGHSCEAENLSFAPKGPLNPWEWDRGVWNGTLRCRAIPSYKYLFEVKNWESGMCPDANTPARGTIKIRASCFNAPSEEFSATVSYTSCGHGRAVGTNCGGFPIDTSF